MSFLIFRHFGALQLLGLVLIIGAPIQTFNLLLGGEMRATSAKYRFLKTVLGERWADFVYLILLFGIFFGGWIMLSGTMGAIIKN